MSALLCFCVLYLLFLLFHLFPPIVKSKSKVLKGRSKDTGAETIILRATHHPPLTLLTTNVNLVSGQTVHDLPQHSMTFYFLLLLSSSTISKSQIQSRLALKSSKAWPYQLQVYFLLFPPISSPPKFSKFLKQKCWFEWMVWSHEYFRRDINLKYRTFNLCKTVNIAAFWETSETAI